MLIPIVNTAPSNDLDLLSNLLNDIDIKDKEKHQGIDLEKAPTGKNSVRGDQLINNFKTFHPNQLNFIITRDDWANLSKSYPITVYVHDPHLNFPSPVKVLPEVVAFVFCYGIFNANGKINFPKNYFFRIRRILHYQLFFQETNTKEIITKSFYVTDTDNIAVAMLSTALYNAWTGSKYSCLKFLDANQPLNADDLALYNLVNQLVADYPEDAESNTFNSRKPIGGTFIGAEFPSIDMYQNGNIFGKERIWDDILLNKFNAVQYTTVNFGYDYINNNICFVFNINDDGIVNGIKCPLPQVCGNA